MKKFLFFSLFISFKMLGQSVELKPGSNGFVMIPNVSTLGVCGVADKGKIVYYSGDNLLKICNGTAWMSVSGAGLSLPFYNIQSQDSHLLYIENLASTNWDVIRSSTNSSGTGSAVKGIAYNVSPSSTSAGIIGLNYSGNNNGVGVYGGHNGTGRGVWGHSNSGYGAYGSTNGGIGIYGSSTTGKAAEFSSTAGGYALRTNGKIELSGLNGTGTNKFLKSTNLIGEADWSDLFPYSFSKYSTEPLLTLTNTHTGSYDAAVFKTNTAEYYSGVEGQALNTSPTQNSRGVTGVNYSTNSTGSGVFGFHAGTGPGVWGYTEFGIGIKGTSINSGYGVFGEANSGVAGQFESNSSYGLKIRGKLQFAGNGVGTLGANKFLKSINTNGDAEWSDLLPLINSQNATQNILEITNTNTGGFSTIVGKTSTTGSGSGVEGIATHTGTNSNSRGVTGINLSTTSLGSGVYGFHAGSGNAVAGNSDDGIGVYGTSNDNIGIKGISTKNNGVYGETAAGNNRAGVFGKATSVFANSYGVYGNANKGSGIKGESLDGSGVEGVSSNGFGVFGNGGYVGGYFNSAEGYALLTDKGKVGIGNIPSLNVDERMEINGRLRIRDSTSTAGVWFNNSTNGIGLDNGAFYGLETAVSGSERAGIWIGSDWRFYINRVGNANFTGTVTATGFPIASDVRYKKNIQPLENTLSKVQKIVGVSYDLRKDEFPEKNFSDQPQIGFIAQDLEKIFPEMVFTDEKGYKSVDYARLTPVLVEALKELTFKNQTLESRLDKIEAMLSTIQPNTENSNSKK